MSSFQTAGERHNPHAVEWRRWQLSLVIGLKSKTRTAHSFKYKSSLRHIFLRSTFRSTHCGHPIRKELSDYPWSHARCVSKMFWKGWCLEQQTRGFLRRIHMCNNWPLVRPKVFQLWPMIPFALLLSETRAIDEMSLTADLGFRIVRAVKEG